MIKLFEQFADENSARNKAIKLAQQFAKDHNVTVTPPIPDMPTMEGEDGVFYGICEEGKYVFQFEIDNIVLPYTNEPPTIYIVPEDEKLGIGADACMFTIKGDSFDDFVDDGFEDCMYKLAQWKKVKDLKGYLEGFEGN